jgi:hypothetical protein
MAGRLTPAQAELVAGCVAGATNVISGYPFDTLKVRLQASPGQYAGMRDCFWKLWRTEGVSAAACCCSCLCALLAYGPVRSLRVAAAAAVVAQQLQNGPCSIG